MRRPHFFPKQHHFFNTYSQESTKFCQRHHQHNQILIFSNWIFNIFYKIPSFQKFIFFSIFSCSKNPHHCQNSTTFSLFTNLLKVYRFFQNHRLFLNLSTFLKSSFSRCVVKMINYALLTSKRPSQPQKLRHRTGGSSEGRLPLWWLQCHRVLQTWTSGRSCRGSRSGKRSRAGRSKSTFKNLVL